ncbi:MAG: acyl-CoA dehydrogenase [Planctomycetota bacterium]|jgi:acyl-CoA dehydrogenase
MLILFILMFALAGILLYFERPYWAWAAPLTLLFGWWYSQSGSTTAFTIFGTLAAIVIVVGGVPMLRRSFVSKPLMPLVAKMLPSMSATEREALDAGTVWWDADLFSGNPDWKKLIDYRGKELTEEEREFLAGPVEAVCGMVTDYDLGELGDLPDEVWAFLKTNGFFGMIVPKEYGGLGFSALAHSAIITKLASRSVGLSVTVMVPNSLGPAELILHYGTQEQKDHYLPRLASGEDIPCFALTEPSAGSDAGSITSSGVVCKGMWQGEEVLGMRLNWDKRYITLAPIADLIGLAFKLQDPEHLLGEADDMGITCALIPADLPGVITGARHDPLGCPFYNGTTQGEDVFVPLGNIIGDRKMAGHGWRMLMQSLAAGRGISLPSMSVGAAQLATRTVGAYATIREQFGLPIGRFEGIEEPLARIGGMTYAMDAARVMTLGAIDNGEQPSVLTAVMKCYLTAGMRDIITDAMDIVGGSGISRGPKNILAGCYTSLPIAITVEGANILTRSMIIFGQGAIRCHPHAQAEITAVADRDLAGFDKHFFGHIGFVFTNVARSFALGVTRGAIAETPVPGVAGPMFAQFTRMSAAFALLADVCMGTLGGTLKFREKVTGRLADAFSWLYIGSAALKRFVDEGQQERDLPYVRWATNHALYQIQEAMIGVLENMTLPFVGRTVRTLLFPFGRSYSPPSDALVAKVAQGLLEDGEARKHLTRDIYMPSSTEPGLGTLEEALGHVVKAHGVKKKIRNAVKTKQLARKPKSDINQRALEAKVIDEADLELLHAADRARATAIAVDAFDPPVQHEVRNSA